LDRNGCAGLSALEEFCAWHGSDFGTIPSYLAGFDEAAAAELRAALPGLRARRPALIPLRRADVPLAALTARLAEWRDQVVYGRGFVLLRRLPVERMAEADIRLAFAALGAHLGRPTAEPHRLHAADCTIPLGTGAGDLSALICLSEPDRGFELTLASAVAVHNGLLAESPALLAALYEGAAPAFIRQGQRLFARFSPVSAGTDTRAAKAHEAALACAEAGALRIDFEPGDMLVLNNHHAVFGLRPRSGPAAAAPGTFRDGGSVLRLALESGLVAAHSRPESAPGPQPREPWTEADGAASQAAA
jgi:hypothetical protein